MGLDMGGSAAGDGSVATVANRRRLDIAADRRARSTPLGNGEESSFHSRLVRHDFVEDRDVTVMMDGSAAQVPRLF
jgi:hypothetical protein